MNPNPIDQLVSQGYGGYTGWSPNEAIADFAKTGGAGKQTQNIPQGYQFSPGFQAQPQQQGFNPAQLAGQMGQGIANTVSNIGHWGTQQLANLAGTSTQPAYDPNSAVSSPDYVNGTPDWIKPIIQKAAQTHNISPMLLSSLLKQESGFAPDVINGTRKSAVGALGVAQFMPATAAGRGVNPLDPESAINGAAQYLSEGLNKYQGDTKKALAAYNAGFGNVDKFNGVPPFPETQTYVKNILAMAGEPHQTAHGPVLDIQNQAKAQRPY